LLPDALPLYEAWVELSSDRAITDSGGIRPVPFASIEAYARRFGFDELDDFDFLRKAVRALDSVYIDAMNRKRGQGSNAGN
jgi:hypothetical protein